MSDITPQNKHFFKQKSERIAAAIFLVSNTMPDTDILRTKIRAFSLELVSLSLSFEDSINSNMITTVKLLENKTGELSSLLDIAAISGQISNMNADVIKQELNKFSESVEATLRDFSISKGGISADFFLDNFKIKDNIKDDQKNIYNGHANNNVLRLENNDKDKPGRKDQRSKCILDLITKKGVVSIKDISMSIKGCSEKTVQRELSNMIRSGLVKKEGERRWSRYSLKTG